MGALVMVDTPSWSDPATWVGAGGLLAIAGSSIKALLDWRKDKGHQRATSEDLVRDDLMKILESAQAEAERMRKEHAAMRTEIREQDERSRTAIRACEERAEKFLDELRKLHTENDLVRNRYHRLRNYIAQVMGMVNVDRQERGVPELPFPTWLDETIGRTGEPQS